jgi:hypothetical protein
VRIALELSAILSDWISLDWREMPEKIGGESRADLEST